MATTECSVDEITQVLDPEGTTVEPTGSRPLEDGITPLVVGQQYVDVPFVGGPYDDYNIDELMVENFTDNPPMFIVAGMVVYEDTLGFRVMFNASPDSGFYNLRWRITI